MKKKEVIILLAFLLFSFLYYALILPKILPPKNPQAASKPGAEAQPEMEAAATRPALASAPATAPAQTKPAVEQPATASSAVVKPVEVAPLENGKIKVLFSQAGAGVRKVILSEWTMPQPRSTEPLAVMEQHPAGPPLGALLQIRPDATLGNPLYEVEAAQGAERVFTLRLSNGLWIEKRFSLGEGDRSYSLKMVLTVGNASKEEVTVEPSLVSATGIDWESDANDDPTGIAVQALMLSKNASGAFKREYAAYGSVTGAKPHVFSNENPVWFGITNGYFLIAARPTKDFKCKRAVVSRIGEGPRDNTCLSMALESKAMEIAAGKELKSAWVFYFGPRVENYLETEPELANVIDYGAYLGWIKKPISLAMQAILGFFYRLTGNYGMAILLLTIVVRIAMHPLTRKQQLQGYRMQLLQPDLKKIQVKHKDNKQKLTEEQMKLWRKHNVSPVGCLGPMILQLPIFLALWFTLTYAIELRKAPFIWWINDLSRPDRIMELPFRLFNIHSIRLLPILSMVSMFLMKPPTPKPDPSDQAAVEQARQSKMTMYLMGVMMGVMFYNMASGLMLYWVASSVFGYLEILYIKKKYHLETPAQAEAQKPGS